MTQSLWGAKRYTLDWRWKNNETVYELETWLGKKNRILATSKEDFYITVNKKDIRNLKVSLEYDGPILAPVDKGTQVANISVTKKGEVIKKEDIVFDKWKVLR